MPRSWSSSTRSASGSRNCTSSAGVSDGAQRSRCASCSTRIPSGEAARKRLKVIFENTDGFEIAREDLLLRGPGEYLGARQSGEPLLRFADLSEDADLLDAARSAAETLLSDHPARAQSHLKRWLGGRAHFLGA